MSFPFCCLLRIFIFRCTTPLSIIWETAYIRIIWDVLLEIVYSHDYLGACTLSALHEIKTNRIMWKPLLLRLRGYWWHQFRKTGASLILEGLRVGILDNSKPDFFLSLSHEMIIQQLRYQGTQNTSLFLFLNILSDACQHNS